MNIHDRINFAQANKSLYQELCIKEDAQKIFTIHDQHLYLESLVLCGKQSAGKPLDLLIKYENKENKNARHSLFSYYNYIDGYLINRPIDSKRIITICQNPNMCTEIKHTVLYYAIYFHPDTQALSLILNYLNINPNIPDSITGYTPLIYAFLSTSAHRLEMLKILLDSQKVDKYIVPKPLLHYAIENDNRDDITFLLSCKNIDINTKACFQQGVYCECPTALHYALQYGKIDCANLLLQSPMININMQDHRGNTALIVAIEKHLAYSKKYRSLIECIIKTTSCNPNIANHKGNTALHFAAEYPKFAYLLLKYFDKEIDLNMKNYRNMTPIDHIIYYAHNGIYKGHETYKKIAQKIVELIDINTLDDETKYSLLMLLPRITVKSTDLYDDLNSFFYHILRFFKIYTVFIYCS